MKIVTYKIDRKTFTIKLYDEQADAIQRAMDSGLASITIAGTVITQPKYNVKGIQPYVESDGVINGNKVKILRQSLKDAARDCRTCQGQGFIVQHDGSAKTCPCQADIKKKFGIQPDDTAWCNKDD